MRRHNWMFVLAVTVFLACSQELTPRQQRLERGQVEERLSTWTRAMNNARQDSIAMMYLQVPELVVTWMDGSQTRGWEETENRWADFYATTDYMNFVVQSPTIEILSPDVAVSTFRHSTDIVRGGRRLPVASGYGTIVWMKDEADGLWKIRVSQIGVSRPSGN